MKLRKARVAVRVRCVKTTWPISREGEHHNAIEANFIQFDINRSANAGAQMGEFVSPKQLNISNLLAIPKLNRWGIAMDGKYWALDIDSQYHQEVDST